MYFKTIASRRDDFKDAVLGLGESTTHAWYKVCLAFQRPLKVMLLPLVSIDIEVPAFDLGHMTRKDMENQPRVPHMRWTYDPMVLVDDTHFSDADFEGALVLMSSEHVGNCVLESYDYCEPLNEVVSWYPSKRPTAPQPKRQNTRAASSSAGSADVLAEHPWLAQYLKQSVPGASVSAVASGSVENNEDGTESESSEACEERGGRDVEGVVSRFEELYAQRDRQHEFSIQDAFKFTLLGGAWQQSRTGREVYGM
eukprot:6467732-Amphidinium_carterae.1